MKSELTFHEHHLVRRDSRARQCTLSQALLSGDARRRQSARSTVVGDSDMTDDGVNSIAIGLGLTDFLQDKENSTFLEAKEQQTLEQ